MKYLYYPGCSLKSNGKAYEESLLAVFEVLDVQIEEIEDWNCCGATSFMAIDKQDAYTLPARNFALAALQKDGEPDEETHIVVPCSACYLALLNTQKFLSDNPKDRKRMEEGFQEAGLELNANVVIRHPLDVLVNDIGLEKITAHVTNPLKGIKIVSNYGCQVIRPYEAFDKAQYPVTLDDLICAIGGEAVDWPLRTRCCGGMLIATQQDVGFRLTYSLLKEAVRRDADLMVTTCPLCQFNLECYQDEINKLQNDEISLPIIYFTQLVGAAFGIPEKELGLHRQIVPAPDLYH